MAEFITPIIDNVISVLKARTPDLLDELEIAEFMDFGKQFTGVSVNFPSVWVSPVRTAFDRDQQHLRHQAHQVRIKFGVSNSDPDVLTNLAMLYMTAIDRALTADEAGDWSGVLQTGSVLRVFVEGHDYGPLFERGPVLARFPELELIVETTE